MRRAWLSKISAYLVAGFVAGALPSFAQPNTSDDPNIRDAAWSYMAIDALDRCYTGSNRSISSDELNGYRTVFREILADAKKRAPARDFELLGVDALRWPHVFNQARDPAPWICDWARISLSQSLWQRFRGEDYGDDGEPRLRADVLGGVLKNAGCTSGPCFSDLIVPLDVAGLLAVRGPYCRRRPEECDKADAAKEANRPIRDCNQYADSAKCEGERAAQQERFRRAKAAPSQR